MGAQPAFHSQDVGGRRRPRGLGVAIAKGLQDTPMVLVQVPGDPFRVVTGLDPFIEGGRGEPGVHRGQGGVAGACHDPAVEAEIEGAGVARLGGAVGVLQPIQHLADVVQVLIAGTGGGDGGGGGFDHPSYLQYLQQEIGRAHV